MAIRCSGWSWSTLRWYSQVAKDGTRSLKIHGFIKQTLFCVSFIALWSQNENFQTLPSCQFSKWSLFPSSTMIMNLGNDWKSAPKSTSGVDEILRRVHGVTLSGKVRSFEICKVLNVEPLLRVERSQLYVGLALCPECPQKDWWGKSCWLHPRDSDPRGRPSTRWIDYISKDLASSLMRSQQKYLRLLLIVRYFEFS